MDPRLRCLFYLNTEQIMITIIMGTELLRTLRSFHVSIITTAKEGYALDESVNYVCVRPGVHTTRLIVKVLVRV